MITLEQWRNSNKFTRSEQQLLNIPINRNNYSCVNYGYYEIEMLNYLSFYGFGLNKCCRIKVTDCATSFIKLLFDKYTNDDTLIITTRYEHPNVNSILATKKHVLFVDFNNDNFNNIAFQKQMHEYDKIFIYISGTQISNGSVVSDYCIDKLITSIGDKNIIKVLDDVQGMFMIPRDYNKYDYIIGTAHSLVPFYDMGILIDNCLSDISSYDGTIWLKGYLDRLKIVMSRVDVMNQFYDICKQQFQDLFKKYNITYFDNHCRHIFAFNLGKFSFSDKMGELLFNNRIFLHHPIQYNIENSGSSIKIRAQEFLRFDYCIDKGIKYLEMLLKQVNF